MLADGSELEQQVAEKTLEVEKSKKQLLQVQENMAKLEQSAEEYLNILQQRKVEYLQKQKDIKSKREEAEVQVRRLSDELEKEQKEQQILQDDLNSVKNKIGKFTRELEEKKNQIKEGKEEIDKLQTDEISIEQKLQGIEEIRGCLKGSVEEKKAQLDEMGRWLDIIINQVRQISSDKIIMNLEGENTQQQFIKTVVQTLSNNNANLNNEIQKQKTSYCSLLTWLERGRLK